MEAKNIIIYTGSFNPVTKGHLMTMNKAIEAIDADKGLFVITPHKYLCYKMYFKSKKPTSLILSEKTRQQMIESLTVENSKIGFGGKELGSASPSTVKTLISVMRKNPNAQVHLLMGADKIHNLPKWYDIDTIIDKIKVIVAVRKGFDIEKEFEKSEWLTQHRNRFVIIVPDAEAFEISSTELRRRFFAKEDYSGLMDLGPYNIMKTFKPEEFPEITDEHLIKLNYLYNGRFGQNLARKLVFKCNNKIFKTWDESLLGNKEDKIKNTKVYKEEFHLDLNYNYDTITDCVNADCADVGLDLLNEGYNPVILNLASNISPGGGYHKGTSAQEECLCQMSTLSQSLYQFGSTKYKHIRETDVENIPGVYPLDINFGGIYSPNVTFFRNNDTKYYSLREEVFSCSIVTVASLSNRKKNDYTNDESIYFNPDGTLTLEGKEIESNKIRTIFRIALSNGHDAIVLGAFGCGVYHLHSFEVSQLFYDILKEKEFKGNFKKVVFAIFEGKAKRGKVVGEDGKHKPFYDLFAK